MKSAEMISKCACGSDLSFFIAKPNLTSERIAKVTCDGCGSKYMVAAKIKRLAKGRDIVFRVKELFLSDKLKEKIRSKAEQGA